MGFPTARRSPGGARRRSERARGDALRPHRRMSRRVFSPLAERRHPFSFLSPPQAAERADVSHGAYRARAPLFSRRRGEPTRLGVPEPRGPNLPRPAPAPSVFFQVFGTVVEPSSFPLSSNAQTKADAGISAFPDGDNIFNWVGTIEGAAGTVRHPSDPLGHSRISSPPQTPRLHANHDIESRRARLAREIFFFSVGPNPSPTPPDCSRRCTRGSRTS